MLQGQHQAQQQLNATSSEDAWLSEQLLTAPHHHPSLAVDPPKASSTHQLPSPEPKQHKRGPGILRAQPMPGWQHQAELRPCLPVTAPHKVVAGVRAAHRCCSAGGVMVAAV